ncbi:hypothetical protein [Streptomyces canus]|uniref:hypothetical protein n=1 Tax=Streptomyces canus TaxID=58343 RepID=UPI00225256BA|nr:hypothetical protein [Streptomyces canus]MCX4855394.1 hypothetical protein [Streptomyces canus]
MSDSAWTGAAVAAVTAGYALFSRRLATTAVSAPMVFAGVVPRSLTSGGSDREDSPPSSSGCSWWRNASRAFTSSAG